MNVGEYGQTLRFNVGEDISATTNTLVLEPRVGRSIETTDVTVPGVAITVGGETYNANEYLEYVVKSTDLGFAGRWRAKVKYQSSPTQELVTDWQRFTVLP